MVPGVIRTIPKTYEYARHLGIRTDKGAVHGNWRETEDAFIDEADT